MDKKRRIAALTGDGHIRTIEQDIPAVTPGTVLVDVHNSLVSPGTELGGWAKLREERDNPTAGATPKPFGYSNAGVVLQTGEGVSRFAPGDRVACVGAGYAQHTNYAVVPHHLCVHLPENVTFPQGSYAMLAATALQALRRNEPQMGEYCAIAGMGLVGQLAVQLHRLAGCYVIGWDVNPYCLSVAQTCAIDATVQIGQEDVVKLCRDFTNNQGLDSAVIAFGGDGNKAYESIFECLKCSPDGHRMGRVVLVGGAKFNVKWDQANIDIRIAARTGAGYHDDVWEVGPDYPPVFMRWTTRTNLELCLRLIAEKKLDVDPLTTHTVPFSIVDEAISAMIGNPQNILGVVFDMKA